MNKFDVAHFFSGLFLEKLNKNTLDSYRVRVNNTMTLLCELQNVTNLHLEKRVKRFATVKSCAEELLDMIKSKYCFIDFGYYGKGVFINALAEFVKKGDEPTPGDIKPMLYMLDSIISCNNTYLDDIYSRIYSIINNDIDDASVLDTFEHIDFLTKELSCQLLHIGFSKQFIFGRANKINRATTYESLIDALGKLRAETMAQRKHENSICFLISASKQVNDLESHVNFISKDISHDYNQEIIESYPKFFANSNNTYYIRENVCALDSISAIQIAKERLLSRLDCIQLGNSILKFNVHKNALVTRSDVNFYKLMPINPYLDGSVEPIASHMTQTARVVEQILNSPYIDEASKERLRSALRYLRIANDATEIGQQYINYWLALEFIFSSPLSTVSTFDRIKSKLVSIMKCCYIKRNFSYLNDLLVKGGYISKGECFWSKTETELTSLIDSITDTVLSFHIRKVSPLIDEHSSRKTFDEYLKAHETNVARHLIRMYRYRNELIHEAAIKQNVYQVTSDLRHYLVFTINMMLSWFANCIKENVNTGLEEMFYHYEFMSKKLDSVKDIREFMLVSDPDEYIS